MNKEIQYDGKKIVYRSLGKGQPVFLVHGFGETGEVWNHQAEKLKNECRLIIPDLPGTGNSEMVEDMSMEGLAEALHAIVHEESIDRCIMIGHSMGGYITLAFAEKYWNHLDAYGLFHSSAFPDSEEKKATRRKGIEFIRQHGAFAFLQTSSPNLFAPDTKENNPLLIERFIDSLSNFSPAALVSYYEAMMQRPDRTAVLKNNKLPVFFALGKYDTAIPLEDGLKLCHMPEKAYIHIFHQSGHMGMLEEPDKAYTILSHFLREIRTI